MHDIRLKIRILLESIFIWLGGVGLMFFLTVHFYSPIEMLFGQAGGVVFYMILTLLVMTMAIRILTEHRKELGERITTGAYIVLNVIPFFATVVMLLSYMFSFD